MQPEPLMTYADVAKLLRVSAACLHKMVRTGLFPPPPVRRHRLSRYTTDVYEQGVLMLSGRPPSSSTPPQRRAQDAPGTQHKRRAVTAAPHRTITASESTGRLRKKYSQADRDTAIWRYKRDVVTGKTTASALARELGVPLDLLTIWAARARSR